MRGRAPLIGLLGIELVCFSVFALLGDLSAHVYAFLLLFSLAATAFLLAWARAQSTAVSWRFIAVSALLLRLPLLPATPSLSDDVWRYLHDGRAQIRGVNPYRYAPSDPATAAFRGPEFQRINHAELPTIYPPAAQLAFAAAAAFGDLWSWKLVVLLFDAALIALLWQLRSGPAVALYAWHPLIIVEFAGSAHMDLVAIAPLLLCLLLLRRHTISAGLAFGAACAAKLLPAAYLLALLSGNETGKRWRFLLGSALSVLLLYAAYGLFGGVPVFGSLGTFIDNWQSNGSLFVLLTNWLSPEHARRLSGALLLALIVGLRYRQTPIELSLLVITFAVLLLSPVVHPWYVLWLVPLLVLQPRFGAFQLIALAWTLTAVFAYAVLPGFQSTGEWQIPAWAWTLEYGLLALALSAALLTRKYSDRSDIVPAQ